MQFLIGTWSGRMVAGLFAHDVAADLRGASQAGGIDRGHGQRCVAAEQVRKPGRRRYVVRVVRIVRYTVNC